MKGVEFYSDTNKQYKLWKILKGMERFLKNVPMNYKEIFSFIWTYNFYSSNMIIQWMIFLKFLWEAIKIFDVFNVAAESNRHNFIGRSLW